MAIRCSYFNAVKGVVARRLRFSSLLRLNARTFAVLIMSNTVLRTLPIHGNANSIIPEFL